MINLYKITQKPDTIAVFLSRKRDKETYHPKWHVTGQDIDFIAISTKINHGMIGLFLGKGEMNFAGATTSSIPCVVLLIGEKKLYVPEQCVKLVTDEEIRQLNCD